ncbi:MAG: hypothetical protein V4643_00155 [Bacteroidota bacterium]
MKTLYTLISLFFLFHLFGSCSTDCPDNTPTTNYVDQAYLPDIIPYSDTSTRRFLKNGSDTLVFTSQGLKETFESGSTLSGDCAKSYKNQKLSLKMAASDTDFFEITYDRTYVKLTLNNKYISDNLIYQDFIKYYPPVLSETVLNNKYDTISLLRNNSNLVAYVKPKMGVIKIVSSKNTYELIK